MRGGPFEHFTGELADLFLQLREYLASGGSDLVVLTHLAADVLLLRPKVPRIFHRVQDRVQRPRTDLVSVLPQLLDHLGTEDGGLRRMIQHMHADKAEKSVSKDVAQSVPPVIRPART